MKLLKHLQQIKLEIDTINAHGDSKKAGFAQKVALAAIEYQADKAIQVEIRSNEDDADSVLQR